MKQHTSPRFAKQLYFTVKKTAILLLSTSFFWIQNICAATIVTTGGGPWEVGATWVGGAVPGTGDDVIINHSVMLSSNVTVQSLIIGSASGNSLEISSGTLTCPAITNNGSLGGASFTIVGITTNNGTFMVNSGSCDVGTLINAPGGIVEWMDGILTTTSLTNNGILNIGTNNTNHQLSGPVNNNGTVNFTDGNLLNGTGGILTNNATGTINLVAQNWSLDIVNNGAVVQSNGLTLMYGMTYSGSGSINIESTLSLGTGCNATIDGEVIVDGTLIFTGNTNTIETAANIYGTGRVIFSLGTNTFDGEPLELDVPVVDMYTLVTGTSTVKIQSGCLWNWYAGGEFGGPNPVENYGTVEMVGLTPEHLIASDFENYGIFKFWYGDLEYTGGVDHFINKVGGELQFDAQTATGWQVPIINEGSFVSDGSPATLPVSLVNETGSSFTVIAGGELHVANTASITQNGSSLIDGILEFQGGNHFFNQTDAFSGAGEIRFTNDLTTINTDGSGWAPAITTVTQQYNIQASNGLTILPGTDWFWELGNMNFSNVTNEGDLHITTAGLHTIYSDLVNEGSIYFEDGTLNSTGIDVILENTATGNIQITTDGVNKTCGAPVNNFGTIEKLDDATFSCFGVWTNEVGGNITVQNGQLYFVGNDLVQSGDFIINSPGIANLGGGFIELNTVPGFTGTGELKITDWPTINSSLGWSPGVASVRQESDVSGTAVLTIPSGIIWEWLDGDFELEGPLTVNGTFAILGISEHNTFADIYNYGTINWSDGNLNGEGGDQTFTNESTGFFNVGILSSGGHCLMPMTNYGTISFNNTIATIDTLNIEAGLLDGSGGLVSEKLNWNGGEIALVGELRTHTTLNVTGNTTLNGTTLLVHQYAYNTFTDATMTLENGAILYSFEAGTEPSFKGAGADPDAIDARSNFPVNGGGITFLNTTNSSILSGPGGGLLFNRNTIEKIGPGTISIDVPFESLSLIDIQEGILDINNDFENTGQIGGSGTIDLTNANVTDYGYFSPGPVSGVPSGTLNVLGNYTNDELWISIEYDGMATTHDQLAISGAATLAGTLYVVESGNVPIDSWTILTAASITGTFSITELPCNYTIIYGPNSVILKKLGVLKTWTGGNGVWSDANGWTPFGVPCPLDTVVIPSGEVTLDIQPQMAILTVSGGQLLNTLADYEINAPFIITLGSILDVAIGFTLDINANFCNSGTIEGNGTVDLEDATVSTDCYGNWSPGNSAGKLKAKGNHTNDVVSIEIGENGGTIEHDVLEVTEAMIVEDELRLSYLGGTVPVGSRVIMECFGGPNCRTGTFDNVVYDLPQGATGINIIYEPTRVLLENTIPIQFIGTVTWLGGDGDWSDQANWSSNDVPNDDDNVIINNGNITMDVPAIVKSLKLTAGNILGNFSLIVNDTLTWSGGEIEINSTTHAGILMLSGPTAISNGSLIVDEAAFLENANLVFGNNVNITLPPGILWTINNQTASSFLQSGSGNTFTNGGTLKKLGLGLFTIGIPFTNSGTTDVAEGVLKFTNIFENIGGLIKGNGTLNVIDAIVSGTMDISPGASPGTLHWLGDFVPNSSSAFNFEILENNGTVTKDLFEVSAAVTVNGVLNVHFLGGTIPTGTYPILTSGGVPNGTFSDINYLPNCPGTCDVVFTTTGINLVLSSPLPLELISFTGQPLQNGNRLNWATTSEINMDKFTIERSNDGEAWTEIGHVASSQDVQPINNYQFFDKNPIEATINYYRLKIFGRDGSSDFSKILAITNVEKSNWQVFPNPTRDFIKIVVSEKFAQSEGAFSIFDWSGKLVLHQKMTGILTELNLSELPNGVYWLNAPSGEGRSIIKL